MPCTRSPSHSSTGALNSSRAQQLDEYASSLLLVPLWIVHPQAPSRLPTRRLSKAQSRCLMTSYFLNKASSTGPDCMTTVWRASMTSHLARTQDALIDSLTNFWSLISMCLTGCCKDHRSHFFFRSHSCAPRDILPHVALHFCTPG